MTCVLMIGGTDSSGGAGLTRDTAVVARFGCHPKPVVTCVTAQTDSAVQETFAIPASVVAAQIDAAFADTAPCAVKIGMIGSTELAQVIATRLAPHDVPIILDPVLRASSGGVLGSEASFRPLAGLVALITPNLIEAAQLTDRSVAENDDEIAAQARTLQEHGAQAVLIKGGHASGATCTDHLFGPDGHRRLGAPRVARGRRGTGCALASAIAAHLALGHGLEEGCAQAKMFVQTWLTQPWN